MDKLIAKYDFAHDNEEIEDECRETLRDWLSDNEDTATIKDLEKCLQVFADKLLKKAPDYETRGWEQARYTHDQILRLVENSTNGIEEGRKFQPLYVDFVLRLMEAGSKTIYFKLVSEVLGERSLDLIDYFKSEQGGKKQKMLQAMVQDVSITETVEESEFLSRYETYLDRLKECVVTEADYKSNEEALLEFQCRLYVNQYEHSEEWCRKFMSIGSDLFREMDTDPWKSTTNIPAIQACFYRCINVFRDKRFASTNEKAATSMKKYLDEVCNNLGTRGLIEGLVDEEFDLLLAINEWAYPDEEMVIRVFKEALELIGRLREPHNAKKPALFQKARVRYMEAVGKLDMKFLDKARFAYVVMDDLLTHAYGKDKSLNADYVSMLGPLLQRPCLDTFKACRELIYSDDVIKWKDHPEVTREIIGHLCRSKIPDRYEGEERQDMIKFYVDFVERFLDGLKKSRLLKTYGEELALLTIQIAESKDPALYDLCSEISERVELNIRESKAAIMDIVARIHVLVDDDDAPWDENNDFQSALVHLLESFLESVKDAKLYSVEELQNFIAVCKSCQKYDSLNASSNESGRFLIFNAIICRVGNWLSTLDRVDLAADLIPGMMKDLEEEEERLTQITCAYLFMFSQSKSGQDVLGKHAVDMATLFLRTYSSDIIRTMAYSYDSNPKAIRPQYKALMDCLLNYGDQQCVMWLCQLFHKVSKKQAELFTPEDIRAILQKAKEDTTNQPTLLQIIQELCRRRPDDVIQCIDLLLDPTGWTPMFYSWINDMMGALALHDKNVASRCLDFLFTIVETYQDDANLLTGLNTIRLIGFKYPELIATYRARVERLNVNQGDAQNYKQSILDMIDGKTPKDLQQQLAQQQNDFNDLVGRVDETEEAVANVQKEVTKQGHDLDNVKNEVNEQGQRLDQVEETVDETVAKVEEIDQKTLSHAPYWSRDVSKLLNPQSDHDWRLLSSRLGYSNDDIRGWAQQADPCMAMLNEWYATRKTSEATHAVYNQLVEMDRTDVAIIVENAMKNAEAVVEDEDFEYASPPAIFLSYQWGHQSEVKLLKQHLEMAGYECWLDVGQMGGGDKLFEKIDSGIRAAKVVISCVTEKYAKSPNCNREVNLSVNLNKPMIPLLLEKCTWPPPGSMGPIFSEYLFIRFFQRGGEETQDERFWPKDKFQELLMQLNMFGLPPEEGKIDKIYRNWWMPVVEEIKIDKSKTKDGGKVSKTEQEELDNKAAESPDVFISYQWGKQKNIIRLYKKLTSLGFSCWLDIKQMGGGDSLYDKIDRGVRGCRVVLSCVTQKYALSANCRREVSLADAVKKPLVPLLLEEMTWPPSGPMSMVMTQLLYIDFAEEDVQTEWKGPKFDELLSKIKENVPRAVGEKLAEEKPADEKPTAGGKQRAERVTPPSPAARAASSSSKGGKSVSSLNDSKSSGRPTPSPRPTESPRPPPSQQGKNNGYGQPSQRKSSQTSVRKDESTIQSREDAVSAASSRTEQTSSPPQSASSKDPQPKETPSSAGSRESASQKPKKAKSSTCSIL